MKLTAACQACLYRNHKDHYPSDASPEKIQQYQTGILKIIADRLEATGPEVVYDIRKLQKELFQTPQDFSAIKSYYNRFMLTKEQEIWELIKKADDPLYKAIQYSLIGNYIDFGA
ncbi:MAG: ARMT1-like domain-containing protein, partial [bacterium]